MELKKNDNSALNYLKISTSKNNCYSQCAIAISYFNGINLIEKNKKIGIQHLLIASSNNLYAQMMLGVCYINGDEVEKDVPKGISLIENSANGGNSNAQFILGKLLLNGVENSVEKNIVKAISFLRKSAKQRNVDAMILLTKTYALEKSVKNYQKAGDLITWIKENESEENQTKLEGLRFEIQKSTKTMEHGKSINLYYMGFTLFFSFILVYRY